jgi:hypothetical protein
VATSTGYTTLTDFEYITRAWTSTYTFPDVYPEGSHTPLYPIPAPVSTLAPSAGLPTETPQPWSNGPGPRVRRVARVRREALPVDEDT